MKLKLTPGQVVIRRYGNFTERLTVAKVGRRWATIVEADWIRIDMETGRVERTNGDCKGLAWESEEQWMEAERAEQAENERKDLLDKLNTELHIHWWHNPSSTENIRAAAKLLGIEIEKKEDGK